MSGTAGCCRQVLHVDGRDEERRVEAVAGQVARVEHDAVDEIDIADGEGAAAGLEVPAAVDGDVGVADAGRAGGVEGGAGGLEQPAVADDDLRPVEAVVAVVRAYRPIVSPAAKLTVPLSVSVVYVLAADAGPIVTGSLAPNDTLPPWFTVRPPESTTGTLAATVTLPP